MVEDFVRSFLSHCVFCFLFGMFKHLFGVSFIFVSFQRYPVSSCLLSMFEQEQVRRKRNLAVVLEKDTKCREIRVFSRRCLYTLLPFPLFSSFPIVCVPLNSSKYHCEKKGKIDQCVRKKLRTSWCHERKIKGKERNLDITHVCTVNRRHDNMIFLSLPPPFCRSVHTKEKKN